MNLSFKKCILFAISLLMGIGCMGQKAGARDDVGRYEPVLWIMQCHPVMNPNGLRMEFMNIH